MITHLACWNRMSTITLAAILFASGTALAQDSGTANPPPEGWRHVADSPSKRATQPIRAVTEADNRAAGPQISQANAQRSLPAQLTLPGGTFVTVRTTQALSSDHNQVGDVFSATLAQPLIVDGVVVAQRGQMIAGRVAQAKKAGMVKGVSQLGVELTDLSLVDGSTIPIHSQLISWKGPTSVGRDVGAVAGTTAFGAAVGAAADWGTGAAIGAGAGAAAGLIGVLLTRGQPTVIYPESLLTFRLVEAVTISTDRAPQAFRSAAPADYQQPANPAPPERVAAPCGPYGCPPSYPLYYSYPYWPPYYGYGYGYGYPYFYGPSFSFYYGGYYGSRFYGSHYGHGGGFGHGHHR